MSQKNIKNRTKRLLPKQVLGESIDKLIKGKKPTHVENSNTTNNVINAPDGLNRTHIGPGVITGRTPRFKRGGNAES